MQVMLSTHIWLKAVYQWIVKPQTAVKQNDMFLPGRMAFIFDMESGFSHDIPTTVYRSKADCPEPKEMVTVSVDGSNKYGMAPKSTGWLQQVREKDAQEKDPNFISDSYSECYPGYQEYNREVVGSDDEDDLSKMDMGGRAKGRLHRWDFETEEERATYNEQKEAMPKAAFQFGVKMQDGRKTRKQIKDQKTKRSLTSCTRLKKYLPKRICKKVKQMMIVVTNLILERNHRFHNPWEIRCDFICVITVSKCLHNLLSISLGKA